MTNKVKLLTAFFVLSFAMMIGVLPFSIGGAGVLEAAAEENTYGAFTVTGDDLSGVSVDQDSGVLTISGSGPYTISNTSDSTAIDNTIKVTSKDGATITLAGVNIHTTDDTAPIEITEDVKSKVTIVLQNENELYTNLADACLLISTEAEVIITEADSGTNKLNMYLPSPNFSGTTYQAVGIGSKTNNVNITISGGNIQFNGQNTAKETTGIGSCNGTANINIYGGSLSFNITAHEDSTAIGSNNGTAYINISGGYIDIAIGLQYYYEDVTGIGSNKGKAYINISDNAKIYIDAWDADEITGIGSNTNYANINISGGDITIFASDASEIVGIGSDDGTADITIEGGTIDITESWGTKMTAIGTDTPGKETDGTETDDTETNTPGKATVKITGGDITITSSNGTEIAGIGSDDGEADITISDSAKINMTIYNGDEITGIGSDTNKAAVNISGGDITININYVDTDVTYTYSTSEAVGIGSDEGEAYVTISDSAKINMTICDSDEITGIGSDDGNADITISDGTISIDVTNGVEATGIGSDTKTASVNISGGNITVKIHTTSADKIAVGIGTDEGKASIYISGGTIEVAVDTNAEKDYAVYTGSDSNYSVYVAPTRDHLINVKYDVNATATEYYYETNITEEVGGLYFYSTPGNVTYGTGGNNVIITTPDNDNNFAVIVSEYGGEGARYLESVMVLVDDAEKGVVIGKELTNYLEYYPQPSEDSNSEYTNNSDDSEEKVAPSIIFNVENTLDSNEYEVICALVKTYANKDANNIQNSISYYLSESLITDSSQEEGTEV